MRILLATALMTLLPFGAAAQSMSDDEIKALALEAIRENPQIIMEAIALIEEQRSAAQAAAQAEILLRQRAFLENDPNAPSVGNPDAETVIVEFFDYNCPYCKRAAGDVKALLAADKDVRVVYREWPILGEGSVLASRAALAARNQGKYEEMHWGLMEMRGRAEEASILALARSIGLDVDQLREDMQSDAVNSHIAASDQLAQNLGFTGTPAFVIGDALVPGAIPLAELQQYIAEARSVE
ncbi:protein-disulfide isomerase [Loktanella sp. PT4BL]|uniref:DsbA family protein n=1 Tax=Loktanella sp. PT4BL TaxID=2135611 RepID=UPI000D767B42|nr:DsbA family protein [Loktanella sp. PT4BL]PXW72472.1 protein-disulfide isomerase [Loktanella sp. PT4BL]